jgi:hypothetical protein
LTSSSKSIKRRSRFVCGRLGSKKESCRSFQFFSLRSISDIFTSRLVYSVSKSTNETFV